MKKILISICFLPLFSFGQNWTQAMVDSSTYTAYWETDTTGKGRVGTHPDSVLTPFNGGEFLFTGDSVQVNTITRDTLKAIVKREIYILKPKEIITEKL